MPVGREKSGDEAARAAACLARLHLRRDDVVLMADPSPENRAWLKAAYPGLALRLTDAAGLRAAILERHGEALKQEAVEGLGRHLPELSARPVLSRGQTLLLPLLAALFMAALLLWPEAVLRLLVLLLSVAFVASGLFRALLAWIGATAPAAPAVLPRRGLPRYTILVPMYREAVVLPGLVAALQALDYPPHLLDIKLVLEADDAETIAAAEGACGAGSGFEIIEVPDHGPRTKPNDSPRVFSFANGDYLKSHVTTSVL